MPVFGGKLSEGHVLVRELSVNGAVNICDDADPIAPEVVNNIKVQVVTTCMDSHERNKDAKRCDFPRLIGPDGHHFAAVRGFEGSSTSRTSIESLLQFIWNTLFLALGLLPISLHSPADTGTLEVYATGGVSSSNYYIDIRDAGATGVPLVQSDTIPPDGYYTTVLPEGVYLLLVQGTKVCGGLDRLVTVRVLAQVLPGQVASTVLDISSASCPPVGQSYFVYTFVIRVFRLGTLDLLENARVSAGFQVGSTPTIGGIFYTYTSSSSGHGAAITAQAFCENYEDGSPQQIGGLGSIIEGNLYLEPLPNSVPVVWVDFLFSGTEYGTQEDPYNTIAEALALAAPAGEIRISVGQSDETIRITDSAKLVAIAGSVRFGTASSKPSPIYLHPRFSHVQTTNAGPRNAIAHLGVADAAGRSDRNRPGTTSLVGTNTSESIDPPDTEIIVTDAGERLTREAPPEDAPLYVWPLLLAVPLVLWRIARRGRGIGHE